MYSELINRFFETHIVERRACLFVFRGFSTEFLNDLSSSNIKYITGKWNGEYPRFRTDDEKISALKEGLASFKKAAWCFYEDFCALALSEGAFTGRRFTVTIVENDIYGMGGKNVYYPLPLTEETLTELSNALNGCRDSETSLLDCYSGLEKVNGIPFVRFVNRHFKVNIGLECSVIGFWAENPVFAVCEPAESPIVIPVNALDEFAYSVENHLAAPGEYVSGSAALPDEFTARLKAIDAMGSLCGIRVSCGAEKTLDIPEDGLLPLLQKYWGSNARFRNCRFYKNPGVDRETVDISQGHIINDVLEQCALARTEGASYSDLIVTAPTGSGKSLFFQFPGIYLHQNHNALTIVISPLIALMVDQVRELNERGVDCATFINGSITFEERRERIQGIKSGRYSIVYLAPELLLAGDITDIIGNREIGLFTVDEAHLVTSWGRDFRVDYWFLGDYVDKLRKGTPTVKARRFPVLCLTATAVYGGSDDVVNDLIRSMHLTVYRNEMYIGFVRRDNIMFMVRRPSKNGRTDKKVKNSCTALQIANGAKKRKKTIVYFPFKSQVDEIKRVVLDEQPAAHPFIESYTGDMQSLDKDKSYNNFRSGVSPVMLATKAFGMGVNIDDIGVVYHYAPTGSLADYVQEIGRAARNQDKVPIGLAITDYLRSDMRYAQTLWGLSGLRHYQLKAMAARLYRMTQEKHSRSLTIEPETFAYMFDDTGLDNRVKSGLMLLSGDLLSSYGFSVLEVNAQSLFTTQYIVVPDSLKRRFLPQFEGCITLMNDRFTQHELAYGNTTAVDTRKTGDIYEIDMAQMWESKFADVSFAQFKKQFFTGELFSNLPGMSDSFDRVVPQMKLEIDYSVQGFENVVSRFNALAGALQASFAALKAAFGGKPFTSNDFAKAFKEKFACSERNEYINMLLDLFSYPHVDVGAAPKDLWKFIEKRKDASTPGMAYCLRTQKYGYISANLSRFLQQMAPNADENHYVAYISISKNAEKIVYQQLIASILQLFDMASCEYTGGRNPHVNVRVNDPEKLRLISQPTFSYRNAVLTDIENRHSRAKQIMNLFLGKEFKDNERWEIIENYFLGLDTAVDEMLGVDCEKAPRTSFEGFSFEGCDPNITPWDEGEETLPWCAEMSENNAVSPELIGGTLRVGEIDYPLHYLWLERKVILPDALIPDETVSLLAQEGFKVFDIRNPEYELIK